MNAISTSTSTPTPERIAEFVAARNAIGKLPRRIPLAYLEACAKITDKSQCDGRPQTATVRIIPPIYKNGMDLLIAHNPHSILMIELEFAHYVPPEHLIEVPVEDLAMILATHKLRGETHYILPETPVSILAQTRYSALLPKPFDPAATTNGFTDPLIAVTANKALCTALGMKTNKLQASFQRRVTQRDRPVTLACVLSKPHAYVILADIEPRVTFRANCDCDEAKA